MIAPPEDLNKVKNLIWALPLVASLLWWGLSNFLRLERQVTLILVGIAIGASFAVSLSIILNSKYGVDHCFKVLTYLYFMILVPMSGLFMIEMFGPDHPIEKFLTIGLFYGVGIATLSIWKFRHKNPVPFVNERKIHWEDLLINTENGTWAEQKRTSKSFGAIGSSTIGLASVSSYAVLRFLFSENSLLIGSFIALQIACIALAIFIAKKAAIALRLRAWQIQNGIELVHVNYYDNQKVN